MLKNLLYSFIFTVVLLVGCSRSVPCTLEKTTETPKKDEVTYAIYAPKLIRPGLDIAFTVAIIDSPNPVKIISTFASDDGAVSFSSVGMMTSGNSHRFVSGMIQFGYAGSTNFTLTVVGEDTVTELEVFSTSTGFDYDPKALSILIQTDKAIYQPGQTIKFRALCMDPELRPLTGLITYKVEDPNGNIVFLRRNVTLFSGVAGGELSLTKLAFEGKWKVIFEYEGYAEVLFVTVENYKLPKFEVNVASPSFIDSETEGFTISLSSKYTFGQAVRGSAKLVLELKSSHENAFIPNTVTKTFRSFDGHEDVLITEYDIAKDLGWDGKSDQRIEVTGFVTETATSTTFSDSSIIELKRSKIKIDFLSKPDTIKPGLHYKALIKVTEQDDSLLMDTDRLKNQLIVIARYQYDSTVVNPLLRPLSSQKIASSPTSNEIIYVFDVPPNGVVTVGLDARNDLFSSISFRAFTNTTKSIYSYSNSWTATRAQSPSNSFIQISPEGAAASGEVSVGSDVQTVVRYTEAIDKYTITLISRGEIIDETTHQVSGPSKATQSCYSFVATDAMTPNVVVLVSYVRDDSEIVADLVIINIALPIDALQIKVTETDAGLNQPTAGIQQVDVGTAVDVKVQTLSASGSYVGIRAIDQSVLLLKSGNDITQERVVEDFESYSLPKGHLSPIPYRYPYSSNGKDASEVFGAAGINVLSNALVYKSPQQIYYPVYQRFQEINAKEDVLLAPSDVSNRAVSSSSSSSRERSFFPETWLWEEMQSDNGSATFKSTIPDTITSWVISAFSMSNEQGLGIADTYMLTAFRKFFVVLDLPLKITRGEIIIIQASVFNYFDQDLDVDLTLVLNNNSNNGITLLYPNNDIQAGPQRTLRVPSGGSVSVKYPVQVDALGSVPIKVRATSSLAGDAVSRNIFVKPEGIEQCYSTSVLVDNHISGSNPVDHPLNIQIPTGSVTGSARASLHVYGNLLGSTISNRGRLLKTPKGCGEQNMLSFAPDVFVTNYLSRTGQLSDEVEEKAFKDISDGYMNELRYKHDDGSFSAFGKRDASGSTWLTAFVSKTFLNIGMPQIVEHRVFFEAMEFLSKQQNKDGSFEEVGRIIHTDIQGGVNSPITMTAYVLITFGESLFRGYYGSENFQASLAKARAYLEVRLDQILLKPYELSLVTYALTLTASSEAERAFTALNALAIEEDGFKYWHDQTSAASTYSSSWQPPYNAATPRDIEMTSYGLLTFTIRRDLGPAAPFLKWLVSKQGELGGYSSTQDTVIAIQALAEMAMATYNVNPNLTITAVHSQDDDFQARYRINGANAIVYNTVEVPAVNGQLHFVTEGVGAVVAQLSVCYNIPEGPYDQEPFDCSVQAKGVNNDLAVLQVCCNQSTVDAEPTGMFIFEIGLLNGFTVDVVAEEERNKLAAMVELEDDRVNIYYDQLSASEGLCATVHLLKVREVASIKAAGVSAYDYYKPERKVTRLYNVKEIEETGPCEVCGSECVGCPFPVLTQWGTWTPCVEFCRAEVTTRTRDCFDESLLKKVDVSRCGLTQPPLETKSCPKLFSCPAVSDGLWYDLPRTYRPSYSYGACRPTNRLSPRTVIPGSTLNGNGDFIYCTDSSLLSINPSKGFTLSFLVKPFFYNNGEQTTFLSIGQSNELPVVSFEKVIGGEKNIRFVVSLGNDRYEVEEIPVSTISAGQWSHVILAWSQNGANVIVNGVEVGIAKIYSAGFFVDYYHVPLQFYLGRSADSSKGFLSGSISALSYWSRVLPESEVNGISAFYAEVVTHTGVEPLLSARHLRSFAPRDRQTCFSDPSNLSAVYASNPVCTDIRP